MFCLPLSCFSFVLTFCRSNAFDFCLCTLEPFSSCFSNMHLYKIKATFLDWVQLLKSLTQWLLFLYFQVYSIWVAGQLMSSVSHKGASSRGLSYHWLGFPLNLAALMIKISSISTVMNTVSVFFAPNKAWLDWKKPQHEHLFWLNVLRSMSPSRLKFFLLYNKSGLTGKLKFHKQHWIIQNCQTFSVSSFFILDSFYYQGSLLNYIFIHIVIRGATEFSTTSHS